MVTFRPSQHEAREDAAARGLREKVQDFAVRGGHVFHFRWAPAPALDWEMDTALPWLTTDPTPDTTTTPPQETHA